MNADQAALWHRIQAHPLDDAHSPHPFSLRLAKENDWAPGYTQRAVEEYRRFAFLAVAAGHPVSPSDPVDQVWHLHLLYTRDYWEDFCGRVLRTPLHHGPARGGAAEVDKFTDWYARTRASYRRFFGEPPAEFWPEKLVHPRARRVDVTGHWILPKPRWLARLAAWRAARRPARPVAAAAAFAATLTSARGATGADYQPLDLRGPEFLQFFVTLAAVVFVAALVLRWYLRRPAALPATLEIDDYGAACLAAGRKRVVEAAVTAACARGLVELRERRMYRTAVPVPPDLPLVERAVVALARPDGTALHRLDSAASTALDAIERDLAEKGLVLHGTEKLLAVAIPAFLAALVPVFGLAKITVGLQRDRPVLFLVLLTLVTLVGAALFLRPVRRTRRGDALLRRLLDQHAALARQAALARPSEPAARSVAGLPAGATAGALPLTVGLFGLAALAGTPHSALASELELERERKAADSSGSGCSTVSSDSGGGDSGGGGGGGGDGGSGCGGCGGGGGD